MSREKSKTNSCIRITQVQDIVSKQSQSAQEFLYLRDSNRRHLFCCSDDRGCELLSPAVKTVALDEITLREGSILVDFSHIVTVMKRLGLTTRKPMTLSF